MALRELGYIEGQNIAIEYRYAEGKPDRWLEIAAEVVRLKVDVIVVSGGANPIRAVKDATKTIPIVMVGFFFGTAWKEIDIGSNDFPYEVPND